MIEGKKAGPFQWIAFTYQFNMTGQPAVTVPAGFTKDGLPIGLQIVRLRAAPGLSGRDRDHGGKRPSARIVACGGTPGGRKPALSAPSRHYRRSAASRSP
jgi:hypothetical protein